MIKQFQYDGGQNLGWLFIYAETKTEAEKRKSELDFLPLTYSLTYSNLMDALFAIKDKSKDYSVFVFRDDPNQDASLVNFMVRGGNIELLLYAKNIDEAERIKFDLKPEHFQFIRQTDLEVLKDFVVKANN